MKAAFVLLGVLLGALFLLGVSVHAPSPSVELPQGPVRERPAAAPHPSPQGRKGVYLPAPVAANPARLEEVLAQAQRFGLNAVVIDVKNNDGDVCYGSPVPLARALGAVRPLLDLPRLGAELRRRGFYVIARQVVFYDPRLARHLGGEGPWVPPTSATAVAYNLALAQEVAAWVDEIQFDYIRFHDDGPIGPDYAARCAAVEAFLAQARAALALPLSVDVFGRVLWPWNARKIDPIGQHLEGMARYVDVISPMLYPSHFVEAELKADPYGTVKRALLAGKARVAVPLRPYLQAFALALPPGMDLPTYIRAQIRAAEEAGADGYLFWNPRADYSALWEALGRDLAQRTGAP
ncbi:MAG: putative glycoside hydrolase [Candidatus Bipolaricaulaceae bacterium]